MKKWLLLVLLSFFTLLGYTQSYFLGTFDKNKTHDGTVYAINKQTKDLKTVLALQPENEIREVSPQIIEISPNTIVGTFREGGDKNAGGIYQINLATKNYELLHSFDSATEFYPSGDIIKISDSSFLGTTIRGGTTTNGVLYTFNWVTKKFSVVHNFNVVDGTGGIPNFILDTLRMKVFGYTGGGAFNNGAVMCYDIKLNTYKKLLDLNIVGVNTSNQDISLIFKNQDTLFGTFSRGGVAKKGLLFTYSIPNNSFSVIFEFDSAIGKPTGSTILIGNSIIGHVQEGDKHLTGLYKYNIDLKKITDTLRFNRITGEGFPNSLSNLSYKNGKLLCITQTAGRYFGGSLLNIDTSNLNITDSFFFTSKTANDPQYIIASSSLDGFYIFNRNGSGGEGVVLYMDNNYTVQNKFEFYASPLGREIGHNLVEAANKNIYVLTEKGGERNKGTIIEISYPSFNYSIHHIFGDSLVVGFDTIPHTPVKSSLVRVSDTLLAFTTKFGGTEREGAICLYSVISKKIIQFAPFSTSSVFNSTGRLTYHNKKIYGWAGGTNGRVPLILYEYDIESNQISVLYDFLAQGTKGLTREGQVAIVNNKLYGLIHDVEGQGGTDEFFAIFELDLSSKKLELYSQNVFLSGLVFATIPTMNGVVKISDNELAFTTYSDKTFNYGKLGILNLSTKSFSWYDLPGNNNGANPVGTPYCNKQDNTLSILCARSGSQNKGSLVQFHLSDNSFSKLVDFGSQNIYSDFERIGKEIIEVNSFPLSNKKSFISNPIVLFPNPAANTITIRKNTPDNFIASLYDLTGKMLFDNINVSEEFTDIDISSLRKGLFIVKLRNKNEVLFQKFIKN